MKDRPVCKNGEEIAAYIGVRRRSIRYLKVQHDLPIFKIEGKGNWKGVKPSLDKWLIEMQEKFKNYDPKK